MLHTLMHSPWQCDIETLLSMLSAGDDLLLLQDGVLGALAGSTMLEKLLTAPVIIWALREDIEARGLSVQISSKVRLIDYTDFVDLTAKHQQQMAW